jgi:hypothetical protein
VTTTFAIFHYANSGESLTVCDPGRLEEETMQVFLFFSLLTTVLGIRDILVRIRTCDSWIRIRHLSSVTLKALSYEMDLAFDDMYDKF